VLISEIFGRGVDDVSEEASSIRIQKHCPFRGSKCTKSSKVDPLGVCSLSDGKHAASICPVRFQEDDRMFHDAARIAFGEQCDFAIFPEIRVLRIEAAEGKRDRKIGKVDFLLGKIEKDGITDFAALEVQAAYFSGRSIRPAMDHFLQFQQLDIAESDRRPDFRSSAQKRLMPQLQLKVPIFRRWGKKFFVVVDSQFFSALPRMKESSVSNSEVIWLNYPLAKMGNKYCLSQPRIVGTHWDDVVTALREGEAPEQHEIIAELDLKFKAKGKAQPRTLKLASH
jgi:Restriction endonuclease NotI